MALADSLYPIFGIVNLRSQKGQRWAEIVDYVSHLDSVDPYVMAFTLTMRRLRRQNSMEKSACKDPLCAVCATSIVESYPGTEESLVRFFYSNLTEIEQSLKRLRSRRVERQPLTTPQRAAAVA